METFFSSIKDPFKRLIHERLNNLGVISSTIHGGVIIGDRIIQYKYEDKLAAYGWAIKELDVLIPPSLRDKAFENNIKKIKIDMGSLNYWLDYLHVIIAQLDKKGILRDKYISAELSPEVIIEGSIDEDNGDAETNAEEETEP